ncbi:hypothetical protein Tco_0377559 [Tanacetum coccineum]
MFEKEKLSGNNFNDWFARLKLVLRVEKKMHVIEQPLPPAPEPVAEPDIVAQWTALYDAHTEIACLMLGSMTPELHRQFELYYPFDMIQVPLEEIEIDENLRFVEEPIEIDLQVVSEPLEGLYTSLNKRSKPFNSPNQVVMSATDNFFSSDDEELSLHDDASLDGSVPASNKGDAPANHHH